MSEIKCHDGSQRYSQYPIEWRAPDGIRKDGYQGSPFRTCSYCGCIHPEDLIKALEAGATMHGSDWKYGWPHKFYVDQIPNPIAGQKVRTGSRSWMENGEQREEIFWGEANATTHGKWYNDHLSDLGDELLEKLAKLLKQHTDIEFGRDEKGIWYKAPRAGYQR